MKRVLICLAVTASVQVFSSGKFVFAETTSGQASSQNSIGQTTNSTNINNVKQFPKKDNVYLGKTWIVRLSKPVDASSVSNNTIKVVEKDTGKAINNIQLHIQSSDPSEIDIMLMPGTKYTPGKDYSVIISKNLKSKDGASLNSDVAMDFKAQYLPTAADDVTAAIMQFDDYTLPTQVDAKLPDGTIQKWNVNWDNNADTGIAGTSTFKGTLEGTDVNVNLTLNIAPYQVSSISNGSRTQSAIQVAHLNYVMASRENRDSIMQRAIQLHYGDSSNTCVYFASESYRRVGFSIPNWVCNTSQLIPQFANAGWKKDYNKENLLPGDQCFTKNDGTGYPTHTYTFVRWVNQNDHSWAYIVDNQGMGLDGDQYHKRDIEIVDTDKFDKFQFFMYKPN